MSYLGGLELLSVPVRLGVQGSGFGVWRVGVQGSGFRLYRLMPVEVSVSGVAGVWPRGFRRGSAPSVASSSTVKSLQVVHRVSAGLVCPVVPSFRALSARLKFIVRRLKFNKDSLSGPLVEANQTNTGQQFRGSKFEVRGSRSRVGVRAPFDTS